VCRLYLVSPMGGNFQGKLRKLLRHVSLFTCMLSICWSRDLELKEFHLNKTVKLQLESAGNIIVLDDTWDGLSLQKIPCKGVIRRYPFLVYPKRRQFHSKNTFLRNVKFMFSCLKKLVL